MHPEAADPVPELLAQQLLTAVQQLLPLRLSCSQDALKLEILLLHWPTTFWEVC